MTEKHDPVTHPMYYTSHPLGYEAKDVIGECPYWFIGTAMKYLWRVSWGGKGNDILDLQKAKQYIEFEIERRMDLVDEDYQEAEYETGDSDPVEMDASEYAMEIAKRAVAFHNRSKADLMLNVNGWYISNRIVIEFDVSKKNKSIWAKIARVPEKIGDSEDQKPIWIMEELTRNNDPVSEDVFAENLASFPWMVKDHIAKLSNDQLWIFLEGNF